MASVACRPPFMHRWRSDVGASFWWSCSQQSAAVFGSRHEDAPEKPRSDENDRFAMTGAHGLTESLAAVSREGAARLRQALHHPQPALPSFADLWTTRVQPSEQSLVDAETEEATPRIVVVLVGAGVSYRDGGHALNVAPISHETVFCSNFDLVVDRAASPLPFEFMVEVWNEVPTVSDRLGRCIGRLGEELRADLASVYDAFLAGQDPPPVHAGRIGTKLLGPNDPRWAFRERERTGCAYLRRPGVAAALGQRDDGQSGAGGSGTTSPHRPTNARGDGEGDVPISARALRDARTRKRWKVSQLVAALHDCGHSVEGGWILDVEEGKVASADEQLVAALAQVLGVDRTYLRPVGTGPPADPWGLSEPWFGDIAREWSPQFDMTPDAFRTWVGRELAVAAYRGLPHVAPEQRRAWLLAFLRERKRA